MDTLYKIEARAVGSDHWYPFGMTPLSAADALISLARLSSDDTTVFRAVPFKD